MTTLTPRQPRVVLYEGSGAEPFAGAERAELVAALLDRGYSVTLAHEGAAAAADEATFVVVGRFAGQAVIGAQLQLRGSHGPDQRLDCRLRFFTGGQRLW